ncbi:hypothetical protein AMS68_000933 [Peltaster fructicola]|uniref:Uncharacterized protein n=1 Tax=Peltaster fructicola TaxID=286661 RepID=A0A6H0XL26_9PEZI|nr:hypothetical protein AMS68_000933 [Peltaster fructicola]
MFYDLNLPYSNGDRDLTRKLHFASELGYNVVVLNHAITGKIPGELTCAIPDPLPVQDLPAKLEIRRRVTLTLTDSLQNARLNALAALYDVLALRPIDERTLQLACNAYDCDIISLDMSQRFGFHFRFKMFSEAIKAGKRIEICYAQGLMGDTLAKRNLISNATQLIRATRGRGIIIASEAKSALGCRGPWDVINLAAVWGLGQERGYEAITKETRGVIVRAQLKRTGYRGAINVIYGGEKTERPRNEVVDGKQAGQKRKADALSQGMPDLAMEKPLSKTQKKKRARLAAQAAAGSTNETPILDDQAKAVPFETTPSTTS